MNMSPPEIAAAISMAGGTLRAMDGNLKLTGPRAVCERWAPILRERKDVMVAWLYATDMQPSDEAAIRRWLEWIGGTPEETAAVIRDCRADPWTLLHFLERAAEVAA